MLIYTCPRCGADLLTHVVTTLPPIVVYHCPKCGWEKEEKPILPDEDIRIPYPENEGADGERKEDVEETD